MGDHEKDICAERVSTIGWMKLYRSLLEHWIWEEKPYSKGQAWIDMLLIANNQDVKRPYKDRVEMYKKGTISRSVSSLATRWGWSRKKTTTFLKQLQSDGMVLVEGTTQGTTITIVNYSFFQGKGTTKDTSQEQVGNKSGASQEQVGNTNKEYKNNKNTRNKEDSPPFGEEKKPWTGTGSGDF